MDNWADAFYVQVRYGPFASYEEAQQFGQEGGDSRSMPFQVMKERIPAGNPSHPDEG